MIQILVRSIFIILYSVSISFNCILPRHFSRLCKYRDQIYSLGNHVRCYVTATFSDQSEQLRFLHIDQSQNLCKQWMSVKIAHCTIVTGYSPAFVETVK